MALVLVVDDEFSVAEVVESILTDAGHEVVTASNGRQGLERANERPPDLVLLDVMMPIMSGPGMLEAMQKNPQLRDVPAVIMSSLPESIVAKSANGMYVAYLRKPFRVRSVVEVVESALRKRG